MDEEKTPRTKIRRPAVLKKLNTENLLLIERGLLGDLPDRLKPQPPVPVRGRPADLVVHKPSSFLSACLPVAPESPISEKFTSSDDEGVSPLRKTFSFRDKISRLSFLSRKDKKWKTIAEDDKSIDSGDSYTSDQEIKASKRFWFFRNKEIERREKSHVPIYKRSKSFEFLPRAIEEEAENEDTNKLKLKSHHSFIYSSNDTMGDAWASNESLEFIAPNNGLDIGKYTKNDDDCVFPLNAIKESASGSSKVSSQSSVSSTNSNGIVIKSIFKRESVQDLLDEFDKTVDTFSENYLSDCEPYTKNETNQMLTWKEKRKSCSFSTLPSPKIVKVNPLKVEVISEDFKRELSNVLSVKRESEMEAQILAVRNNRRGSVTDWFVLEESSTPPDDKYRRASKKPTNRVRRMSSTKYWITPEECAVYSRDQRPPLVIPRITQYRGQRQERYLPPATVAHSYPEDTFQEPSSVKSSVRQFERLPQWSPVPDRELDHYSKSSSNSPRAVRLLSRSRLAGSTENLLARRPDHLALASSSGDSLDVEVRERQPVARNRKSKSMIGPKHTIGPPMPVPRIIMHSPSMETTSFQATVVQEGPIKRTKFAENTKKCKKNWQDCYMILTQTALVFYKDQKAYQLYRSSKLHKPGTPPSPTAPRAELVLALRNASIAQCIQMHTRRHSRSILLMVGQDYYLLQDETEEGAKRWLNRIKNVIYNLGPPTEDEPTLNSQSSNTDLESIGRTPPATRHNIRNKQKGGGSSNEDLSDSTEASIQKSHVKSRLRKFFAKRPAMEVLVKKGIYKDEPVFGRNLEEVCPVTSPRVPQFVVSCVSEIEKSEENMTTDGLYRASGNLSQVQKIRLEIDQNNMSVIEDSPDIHVLTGSLKLFFRELKEPLIPWDMFDRVLDACSIKPRDARVKEFRDIVNSLPTCNRDTLKFLLEHLLRVTKYSEKNRMHTANLAIVFGPTLLWAPQHKAHNIAVNCIQQNNVVDILLTDFKEIFNEESKSKKKS